jgi:hypothetical protein
MWRYTFTYMIAGVETFWIVETEPKTVDQLIEMFDANPDIPNGIQVKINGVAI